MSRDAVSKAVTIPRGRISQVRNTNAVETGRPPGSGVSNSPAGGSGVSG